MLRKLILTLITLFTLPLVMALCSSSAFGKSWRGITPLQSTVRDVAKFSQTCETAETRCQFTLDGQDVMVVFSGSTIGDLECPSVPKGTVLAVTVRFRNPQKLQGLKLKQKAYTIFDPSSPPKHGYKTYYYSADGFMINTYKGKAIELVYIAAQQDIRLCPQYYADPKAFVDVGLIP